MLRLSLHHLENQERQVTAQSRALSPEYISNLLAWPAETALEFLIRNLGKTPFVSGTRR